MPKILVKHTLAKSSFLVVQYFICVDAKTLLAQPMIHSMPPWIWPHSAPIVFCEASVYKTKTASVVG